ncbi:hypothetical protein L1987_72232 [Smallanthus sonchifolius]|uniref:Uncharacterized protein n=1 Tax=Smallanthus sonchifolius TaxID=185202 RepID=A0ACB9AVH6_9ASTR|nr:hypothetical protein L1987_72232 [Smallanthus sonchifolius]
MSGQMGVKKAEVCEKCSDHNVIIFNCLSSEEICGEILEAPRKSMGRYEDLESKLSLVVSDVKEGYMEKSTGDKNQVKDRIHGNVGDGKQEDETKEVREHEGGCVRRSGSEESNAVVDDGEQVPKSDPVTMLDGSNIHSSADTSIKCINDENSEERNEQRELVDLSQDGGSSTDARELAARKKTKHGRHEIGGSSSLTPLVVGGAGSSEPSVQQANRTFRLFGVNIPYEKEHEVLVIHQTVRRLRLFGVDIVVPQEEELEMDQASPTKHQAVVVY